MVRPPETWTGSHESQARSTWCGLGAIYKLGRSNAVGRRMYELRIQLAERLELVHSFETDDPEGIERYWHDRFAAKRSNGEWFSLGPEDVAAFKRRRSYM